ncbi:MAG: DNA polymerase III subunit beta [Bacteroidales bacterium]|nr:DNA polymerase III subunit beta [Bacteroidales bacterium]MBR2857379.1 DNA polymerase III subunit beta [Bacteroidales bacterium]
MKLIISSSELLRGVMAVAKAIPAKSPLPILENFLFDLKGNVLEITASDSELTLKTQIEVENTAEEGRIAVPAKHMMDLLKELPDQPLTISTTSDSSFVCSWASGESTLPYFPAEDYPEITGTDDTAVTLKFPAQSLVDGISSTIYATADDEIRPAMNGILFDIDLASTTLVASDSHKLICYTTTDVQASEKASFILHKKPAAILKAIIGKDADNVEIAFDSKNAVFRFGQTEVICRLVVGKYPKYRDVIPQNNSNILRINRVQLLNTVRRVSVCSNKASNHIKFDLKSGSLMVSAQDLGFSIAAHETMQCQYDGEDLTIGFKSPFIIEILSNMNCGELVMKFLDSKRAALVVPAEEEEESEKICGIIMPIMIS